MNDLKFSIATVVLKKKFFLRFIAEHWICLSHKQKDFAEKSHTCARPCGHTHTDTHTAHDSDTEWERDVCLQGGGPCCV